MIRIKLVTSLLFGVLAALPLAAAPVSGTQPFQNLRFRNLGPAVAGGRVTAVVGIPGNPRIYYVGTAGGGIFKSEDGGVSWFPIFQNEPVSSIGAIALAPSNPELIWVGTGEGNLRNDVISGNGVYFSPDGGRTWRHVGLADAGQISSIIVDSHDPNVVLVGVVGDAWGPSQERGVFRTTDGGKTWQKVLYVNDTTGVSDMAMDPQNPRIVYAGMWQIRRYPWEMISGGVSSGIYKSVDGGASWSRLAGGLPPAPMGRVGLAVAPSNPSHVYAVIGSKSGILWQSLDAGEHWAKVSDNWLLDARPWYFGHVAVSPSDENRIYLLSFDLLLSDDGGRTVRKISNGIHPDNHTIWIDPRDPSRVIEGNDGGVYLSANGGETWRFADGLPIEQFYSLAVDNRTPFTICGGLQDNSAWCGPSSVLGKGNIPNQLWWAVIGGDGQYAVPASNSDLVYADSQNGVISVRDRVTGRGGQIRSDLLGVEEMKQSDLRYRFDWTSPIAVSPGNPRQVYLAGNVLFRSDDAGAHWRPISPDLTRNDKSKQVESGGPIQYDLSGAETYDTILSISISAKDPKVIWVGTDDGLIQRTSDGGLHWANVTPKAIPEWGRVEQIEASPFDPNSAYVAIDCHETDDNRPYVLKTRDGGATWQAIDRGLPQDAPAHVVREDPNREGLLVLGTDTGLFYSTDDGGSWLPLKANFPTAPVFDIKFQAPTHDLVIATHGRGLFVLDDIAPLEELTPPIRATGLHLFNPLPAFVASTFNRYGNIPTHGAEWSAPNRPLGAIIQYYIGQAPAASAKVKITIKDSHGEIVRKLEGPSKAGVNQIVWDLAYDPAPKPRFMSQTVMSWVPQTAGGPPVVPGVYTIAISVGGQTATKTIQVGADPRFPEDLEAMRAQTEAGLKVRDITTRLVQALDQCNLLQEQLASIQKTTPTPSARQAAVLEQAKALDQKLETWSDPLFNPAIQSDPKYYLHYLARTYDRLQRLMNAIYSGYATLPSDAEEEQIPILSSQTNEAIQKLDSIVHTDVTAFDRQALAAGMATIRAGSGPDGESRRP